MVARPRRLLVLDEARPEAWRVEENAVHEYKGRLWTRERGGCLTCCAAGREDAAGQTLRAVNAREFICLTHGPLVEVPLRIVRHYTVELGYLRREDEEKYEDSILVAASMSEDERQAALETILEQIDAVEKSVPVVDIT